MPNRVNQLLLGEYARDFKSSEYLIVIGYEGLPVNETGKLRGQFAGQGFKMKFVKNRIVSLAFSQMGVDGVKAILKGQCAFVYGDDPVAMARTIRDFAKEHKQVQFRGAIVEKTVLKAADAAGLAEAASKQELKSRIAAAAMGPARKLAAAVVGPASMVAGAIKAHADKLEKNGAAA